MNPPAFDVGSVAYIRESAGVGDIEPVRIAGVHKGNGAWLYTISYHAATRNISAFGDRISQVNGQVLYFTEDEFVDLCTACDIAETYINTKLERIRSMRDLNCSSDLTSGTQ